MIFANIALTKLHFNLKSLKNQPNSFIFMNKKCLFLYSKH